jgi:hypothetical protein
VTLNDWERNGWLQAHRTAPEEVADFLALVERDLADSRTPGLSADWRLNIAYNAALQPRPQPWRRPDDSHLETGLRRQRREVAR